jgi:hypothetical protein
MSFVHKVHRLFSDLPSSPAPFIIQARRTQNFDYKFQVLTPQHFFCCRKFFAETSLGFKRAEKKSAEFAENCLRFQVRLDGMNE